MSAICGNVLYIKIYICKAACPKALYQYLWSTKWLLDPITVHSMSMQIEDFLVGNVLFSPCIGCFTFSHYGQAI